MDFNKKRYQKYRPIINKTVHRLLKEDRFDFDVGYSFINVDDHVFFGLDVNQFVDEFFKKKYFTKPKYRNYKYVFFISRSFPDDFLKKEKVTTIDFPPVLMRNLKVKTPLSITDLLRLNDSVLKHFPLMYFLRSIYDNKYNADQQMLDSGDFEKILESGQKKKIADIMKYVDMISKSHQKSFKNGTNLKYVCQKYCLQDYFSKKSNLNSILSNEKFIIVHAPRSHPDDTIRPNVMSLLLYYISEFNRNNKQDTIFFIDDIHLFTNKYSDCRVNHASIFRMAFNSVNNRDPLAERPDEKIEHLFHFNIFTNNLFDFGEKEEEIGDRISFLLNFNEKIIFNISTYFYNILLKYYSSELGFIARLNKLGQDINEYWDDANNGNEHDEYPFMLEYYDYHASSSSFNPYITPIDFDKYPLNEKILNSIILSREILNLEFKLNFKGCKNRIKQNVIGMLRSKGGNIIIGIENKMKAPIGITLKEEGNFNRPSELCDNMMEFISSNIKPLPPPENIRIHNFTIKDNLFITITVLGDKDTIYYDNKGQTWKRLDGINKQCHKI